MYGEHPKFLDGGTVKGCGSQGGGGEGSGRETAQARGARGPAMPTLCQIRDSCRASPESAWLVAPASMELTGQGWRAHSSREETKAWREDSTACRRSPAGGQLAKASGSKQDQGNCPRLLGTPGGALEIIVSRLPFSKKAEGSMTLARLLTMPEPDLSSAHEGPGDPPHKQLETSNIMHRPGKTL